MKKNKSNLWTWIFGLGFAVLGLNTLWHPTEPIPDPEPIPTIEVIELTCSPSVSDNEYSLRMFNLNGYPYEVDGFLSENQTGAGYHPGIGEYYMSVAVGKDVQVDFKDVEIIGAVITPQCESFQWVHVKLHNDHWIDFKYQPK